jgi:hypothetical protein
MATVSSIPKTSLNIRTGLFISVTFILLQILWSTLSKEAVVSEEGETTFMALFQIGFGQFFKYGIIQILLVISLFLFSHKGDFLFNQISLFLIIQLLFIWMGLLHWIQFSSYILYSLAPLTAVYISVENISALKIKNQRFVPVVIFAILNGLVIASSLQDHYFIQTTLPFSKIALFSLGVILAEIIVAFSCYTFLIKMLEDKWKLQRVIFIILNINIIIYSIYWFFKQII